MTVLRWRKEPPDQPGWWWTRAGSAGKWAMAWPHYFHRDGEGVACPSLARGVYSSGYPARQWSGSIAEPEEATP